ncbi:MAG: hypothetical protein IKD06_05500 [Clostridia bacterium]|nr:hypothetical protein [Clostridia bacterium]
MESVKSWALQAALTLSASGILQWIVPEGSLKKTVSFCLSCCILCILLTPFLQTVKGTAEGLGRVVHSVNSPSSADMQDLTKEFLFDTLTDQTQAQLCELLSQKVGFSPSVQVIFQETDQEMMKIEAVTVGLPKNKGDCRGQVSSVLAQVLGTEVRICFVTQEDSP